MTTKTKPTDQQIKEAFDLASDAIANDMYQLWRTDDDSDNDFEMTREEVTDYLHIYGGPHGKAVYDWCGNLTPEDFEAELTKAGVPTAWHE